MARHRYTLVGGRTRCRYEPPPEAEPAEPDVARVRYLELDGVLHDETTGGYYGLDYCLHLRSPPVLLNGGLDLEEGDLAAALLPGLAAALAEKTRLQTVRHRHLRDPAAVVPGCLSRLHGLFVVHIFVDTCYAVGHVFPWRLRRVRADID